MRILIVVGHPNPASFNHAIAHAAAAAARGAGHEAVIRDLAAERFDPCLPTAELVRDGVVAPEALASAREVAEADGLVMVHPNWWGMPPAVMAGWIDRSFRPGIAYRFVGEDGGEGVPEGLLRARRALVFNTSDTEAERETHTFGDPLELIWKRCVFGLCGVQDVRRTVFRIVITSTAEQRAAWLAQVRAAVHNAFGT